jgi:hypothetical protein
MCSSLQDIKMCAAAPEAERYAAAFSRQRVVQQPPVDREGVQQPPVARKMRSSLQWTEMYGAASSRQRGLQQHSADREVCSSLQ